MFSSARLAAFAFAAVAVFSGVASAETRRVDNVTTISSVEAAGRYRVEVVAGDRAGATLTGPSQDIARVGVRYRDGVLRLWEKCTLVCGRRELDVVVRIVAPQLGSIELAKGIEATATGVSAQTLTLDVAMGATLSASGVCETLRADVAMGGVLSAKDLSCERVVVDAAMGGTAEVRARSEANADAAMGGVVTIHGNPPRLSSGASMGGVINLAEPDAS
ncbi:MAG: DUF2807 domain-containing protein [Hyphomonadaceae bacterium]|nr:DUF2807 domain-containing protein [Hyphomonadaceae bacterium]